MFLLDDFEDAIEYNGTTLHLDMTYDNVLAVFEMLKDEGISEFRKITAALEMFLYDYWKTEGLPFDEQYELFKDILREFLNIDMDAQGKPGQPPKKKEYDFNIDAERIYAS